jgi:hypothetical protein
MNYVETSKEFHPAKYVKMHRWEGWPIPVISVTQKVQVGGSWSKEGHSEKHKILSEKLTKAKRTGAMAQVCSICKHRAPYSSFSTSKMCTNIYMHIYTFINKYTHIGETSLRRKKCAKSLWHTCNMWRVIVLL